MLIWGFLRFVFVFLVLYFYVKKYLDKRWEAATGEVIDEVIFLSKHTTVSNRPTLTVHPIGVPHLREIDVSPAGGNPGWAAPPNPRIGPWLKLLKTIAHSHNLTPEFEVVQRNTGRDRNNGYYVYQLTAVQ